MPERSRDLLADVPDADVSDLDTEYEMLGELGRGGSAIVYRARDRALGREVAIKVVRPRHASVDDDSLQRLAREARTVAGLQHPNIVTVHAVKRLHDGGLALVMQLVPGRTLKQAVVAEGPLAPSVAERIIRDVAGALAYAHAHGVVHRDVKPENIFLETATGRALLSDFGIAHSAEFDSRLTMTGTAIGTPAYMSPEQIDGKPTDARSDVFSLGLVAWEMLTGQRPWENESLYSVIYKQKHDELPAIDSLRPGVSPRLQYIVERMLQKRPAARWAGADGLLAHMNASVLPADWGQWQDAHRQRKLREKAAAAAAATPSGFLQAALATIRFRRPAPGDPMAEVGPAALVAIPVEMDDLDATPTWARTTSARRHVPRLAVVAVVLVLVLGLAGGGIFAVYANRPHTADTQAMLVPQLTDDARVQVPVGVAPFDSMAARIGDRAADSTMLSAYDTVVGRPLGRAAIDTVLNDASAGGVPGAGNVRVGSSAGALAIDSYATARGERSRMPVRPTPTSPSPSGSSSPLPATGTATPVAPPAANIATVRAAVASGSGDDEPIAVTVRSTDDRGIIAAGGRHSCAIDAARVLCWGANDRGQLGGGDAEARATPEHIVGDLDFVQVAAGIAHSCGVTRGGEAYCWGNDDRGQLGDATTTSRSAPVRVASNATFRFVRAGLAHSCALAAGGLIACWGENASGQLGDGTTNIRSSPVALDTRLRFIAVSAGWNHSCALATDGLAYCWGDNASGQLGDGSRTRRLKPEAVAGNMRFTSITAGSSHSCAVNESGDVYCWGRNNFGQLGTGVAGDRITPGRVESASRFISVSAGSVHTCARTRGGAAFCWGRNSYGQVGDGSTVDRAAPVRVAGPTSFAALNAAGAHTCGVTADGEVDCWGYNNDGQLGDGTRNHRSRPTRVTIPVR